MHHFLPRVMPILWGLTVAGNAILVVVLVGLRHHIRYGFLTLWCLSSVIVDAVAGLAMYSHHAPVYPHYWLFTRYALTFLIEAMVILEAFKWREWRIEYPVSAQLFLGIVSLVIQNTLHYGWGIYYFECFTRLFNFAVILWMLFIFRKEPCYDRPNA